MLVREGSDSTPQAPLRRRIVAVVEEVREVLTSTQASSTLRQAGLPVFGGTQRVLGLHARPVDPRE
jgi:hypothetical protein